MNEANKDVLTDERLVRQYYQLCDERDAIYKETKSHEDELTKVNSRIEEMKAKQSELAELIDKKLRERNLLGVKREIARIARFLGKIPPRAES